MTSTLRHLIFWCLCKGSQKIMRIGKRIVQWQFIVPILVMLYPLQKSQWEGFISGVTIIAALSSLLYVSIVILFELRGKHVDWSSVVANMLSAVVVVIGVRTAIKNDFIYQMKYLLFLGIALVVLSCLIFLIDKIYQQWASRFVLTYALMEQKDLFVADLELLGDKVIPEAYRSDIYIESIQIEATRSIFDVRPYRETAIVSFWLANYHVPITTVRIPYPIHPYIRECTAERQHRNEIAKSTIIQTLRKDSLFQDSESKFPKNDEIGDDTPKSDEIGEDVPKSDEIGEDTPKNDEKDEHTPKSDEIGEDTPKSDEGDEHTSEDAYQDGDTNDEESLEQTPQSTALVPTTPRALTIHQKPVIYVSKQKQVTVPTYQHQPLLYGKAILGPEPYQQQPLVYQKPVVTSPQKKKKKKKKRKKK